MNIDVFLDSARVGLADETFARRKIFLRTTPFSWSNFHTNGSIFFTLILICTIDSLRAQKLDESLILAQVVDVPDIQPSRSPLQVMPHRDLIATTPPASNNMRRRWIGLASVDKLDARQCPYLTWPSNRQANIGSRDLSATINASSRPLDIDALTHRAQAGCLRDDSRQSCGHYG
jgi:hypothetical protein